MLRPSFLKKKTRLKEDMALQITSMADILTILLVFLLKSYASGMINISPTKGLRLPEATAGDASAEAMRLEITGTGVLLEGEPVLEFKNYQFPGGDILASGASRKVEAAIALKRKLQVELVKRNEKNVELTEKVLVLADQDAPYSAIKTLLASAATQGYTDFKLVVVERE